MKNDFSTILAPAMNTASDRAFDIKGMKEGKDFIFAAANRVTAGLDLKKVSPRILGAVKEIGELAKANNVPAVQRIVKKIANILALPARPAPGRKNQFPTPGM